MYIEKNGYVIMKTEEMSFLDRNGELSDDIEDADVYDDLSRVKQDVIDLNEEGNVFEVVAYHKTIWLDKMGLINEKTTCSFEGCQCCSNDINDFGIPASVLDEVAEQQKEQNDILESLIENGEEVDE